MDLDPPRPARETPCPPVRTLLTGHERREPSWCWRPDGTPTPLLVHTRSGGGRVRARSARPYREMIPGDTVLWLPGVAQDFGTVDPDQPWEIVWAHFQPMGSWSLWLGWPELAAGVRWLPSRDPALLARVDQALLDMVAATHAPTTHSRPLAMNSLERALLWLDATAPGGQRVDGRIHDAIDFIAGHLHQPIDVPTIAAVVHLSPSRLSHLFKEQLGVAPSRFVEQRRIERAQQLLDSTSMSIASIARATGFSSQFYFATRFKAATGIEPTRWRRNGPRPAEAKD